MYAISLGQREVTQQDRLAEYVPTSHVGVEIGSGVGLHYHYGTLGQLEHGVNYAKAYLRSIGKEKEESAKLSNWPYPKGSKVKLFVFAGHRNMEGERSFIQDLVGPDAGLLKPMPSVAYKYNLAGGQKVSNGWEALRPTGLYDTFGPELSFARELIETGTEPFAIGKFTHSGSQIIDWTPDGSMAKSRNLYRKFISFINECVLSWAEGNVVELAGIVYHLGENDMSMPPYRRDAAPWLEDMFAQSRIDLADTKLPWFVSQQPPTKHERVDAIDVVEAVAKVCKR